MTKEQKLLRVIRDGRLKDMDGVVLKYLSMGQPVPDDIKTYLQKLRDLPQIYSSDEEADFPAPYPTGQYADGDGEVYVWDEELSNWVKEE